MIKGLIMFTVIRLSVLFFALSLILSGCTSSNRGSGEPAERFERLFCWGAPWSEQQAQRYASAGVTDIMVKNHKQYLLAKKYGMTPYWQCFTPVGPHRQVMTPEEEKYHDYINGKDLDKKLPKAERTKILDQRRIAANHRYGGEMVRKFDTLNTEIACFNSDTDFSLSAQRLDALLKNVPPDVAGMYIDYIGYMNHNGCYCQNCLAQYQQYLTERKLADTPENKTAFYLHKIVEYYNKVTGYVKSRHPHFKFVVHIYPDFKNDPLYGNRTPADYCGQTVSWYFKFSPEKIRQYTKFVVNRARDHHNFVQGLPFIGLNTQSTSSLAHKTPQEVEEELQIILASGGRTLLVCSGSAILKEGYYEVFKKYCTQQRASR